MRRILPLRFAQGEEETRGLRRFGLRVATKATLQENDTYVSAREVGMRTRTLAVMFTDIKGYTAHTSSHPPLENAALLRNHRRLVHPILRSFGGTLVKTIGDAFMVVFESPTKAVQSAMAIQDCMWLHNRAAPQPTQLHLRIAINLGEMRVERGDYFGDPVNIAARMEGVTPADEIYLSDAVYLAMNRQNIATGLVGTFEFKGIPEPIRVHRVTHSVDRRNQPVLVTDPDGRQRAVVSQDGDREAFSDGQDRDGPPYGGAFVADVRRRRMRRVLCLALPALLVATTVAALLGRERDMQVRDQELMEIEARIAREDFKGATQRLEGFLPTNAAETARLNAARRRLAWAHYRQHNYERAQQILDWLLAAPTREAKDQVLAGHLAFATAPSKHRQQAYSRGLEAYEEALVIDPRAGNDYDLSYNLVSSYRFNEIRARADWLVSKYLGPRAVQALTTALQDPDAGFALRQWYISRLKLLKADEHVDWTTACIRDLEDGSCKYKRQAIEKLAEIGDPRAVGPLLKLGQAGGCGATEATAVARSLIRGGGVMP